ncbi:hypothetical protein CO540_27345 [Micromonospora sp. WMMA2032]|nr:hypothetical protein CO540_27345 [Micromonospora sp. WMMA2032]
MPELVHERYKFVLQQLHATNENVYRFLAIYQSLATALSTAALALFVGYEKWQIGPAVARAGIRGFLTILTGIALFAALLVVVGTMAWVDYRKEECEILAKYYSPDLRHAPRLRNFYRWYETYVFIFIVASAATIWVLVESIIIPQIN